jgi:hypothetical protein
MGNDALTALDAAMRGCMQVFPKPRARKWRGRLGLKSLTISRDNALDQTIPQSFNCYHESEMRHRGPVWEDTAQFCINGHLINAFASSQPDLKQKFCEKCGGKTIFGCPHCSTPFTGAVHNAAIGGRPVAPFIANTTPPSYCRACGNAMPWTTAALQAAGDLADLQDNLTPDEKELVKKDLDEITRDTPRTTVSAERLKTLGAKAGRSFLDGLRTILISVATEAAKKVIFPNP